MPNSNKPTNIPRENTLERYDWSRASRGRFAGQLHRPKEISTREVTIPNELWIYFGSDENVCEALTLLATTSQKWKRASGE